MKPDPLKQLDETFHCPKCDGEIEYVQDLQNPQPVKKGNIVVCGHCGSISQIGDSNLVLMTKAQLDALDKQSKAMLAVAVGGVMSEIAKRKAGISGN